MRHVQVWCVSFGLPRTRLLLSHPTQTTEAGGVRWSNFHAQYGGTLRFNSVATLSFEFDLLYHDARTRPFRMRHRFVGTIVRNAQIKLFFLVSFHLLRKNKLGEVLPNLFVRLIRRVRNREYAIFRRQVHIFE